MYRVLLFVIFLLSCVQDKKQSRDEINKLINSTDKTDVIEGFKIIGDNRDTSFVKAIFTNPGDPRISNDLRFKGMSVYQSKMYAIEKITGVEPPAKISYLADTTIINFYFMIARKQKLI